MQRWAKWEERARTLSRVKHELQQRLENCQARIVAAQAQEAATREAVQRWHAEGLEQILRQKLQTVWSCRGVRSGLAPGAWTEGPNLEPL